MPSTSNTRLSCRLTAAQSSTSMPPGLSMNRRNILPPFADCSSTSSYPMPATTGSTTACTAAINSRRALKQKMGRSPSCSQAPKLLKFNRISLHEQPFEALARQFPPFAGLEIARQLDWPVAHPQEPADAGAERLEHAPHFPVAALLQRDPIPAVSPAPVARTRRLYPPEGPKPIFQIDAVTPPFKV